VKDPILNYCIKRLREKYKCHTVILYGSRARGDWTESSDYDVMGFSKSIKDYVREAKKYRGKYLDMVAYGDKIQKDELKHMRHISGGTILLQKGKFGTNFLKAVDRCINKGPEKLPKSEIQVKKVWPLKMLGRSQIKDAEGRYRRYWLIISILEDFFLIRNKWFNGSKKALRYLQQKDPQTYKLYLRALKNPWDNKNLVKLIKRTSGRMSTGH
jgi:uncharacterized protein